VSHSPLHADDSFCQGGSGGIVERIGLTLSHKAMREHVEKATAESYTLGEEWQRSLSRTRTCRCLAGQFVRVLHAMIEGLVLQRLLIPESIPDYEIRAAFTALAKKNWKTKIRSLKG
jgi:hypothetical protein